MSSTLQGVELSRLKWQSRRGLLENDLVLESFYRRYETELTPPRVAGLNTLLDLGDNDLWLRNDWSRRDIEGVRLAPERHRLDDYVALDARAKRVSGVQNDTFGFAARYWFSVPRESYPLPFGTLKPGLLTHHIPAP